MSGRVRVTLEDGRRVTGYRKTLRRNPRRPLIERLHSINQKCLRRFPSQWKVRIGFRLPEDYRGFVADGTHGSGINVLKGFVQISGDSSVQCYQKARDFLATVIGDNVHTITTSVISIEHPGENYGRFLTTANGALFVTGGLSEPKVFT